MAPHKRAKWTYFLLYLLIHLLVENFLAPQECYYSFSWNILVELTNWSTNFKWCCQWKNTFLEGTTNPWYWNPCHYLCFHCCEIHFLVLPVDGAIIQKATFKELFQEKAFKYLPKNHSLWKAETLLYYEPLVPSFAIFCKALQFVRLKSMSLFIFCITFLALISLCYK